MTKNKRFVKLISVMLVCVMVMVMCMGAASVEVDEGEAIQSNVCEMLLDPELNQYFKVADIRQEIALLQSNSVMSEYEKESFYSAKNSRNVEASAARATPSATHSIGYGFGYKESYLSQNNYGRAISFDVICPTKVGGNVEDYLYLTATNSLSHGVEAYISYYSQNNFEFKIFDWALAGPGMGDWALTLSYKQMSNYVRFKNIRGVTRQVVTVQNHTVKLSNGNWENKVYLQKNDFTYDLIYSFEYSNSVATAETLNSYWGPIIEAMETNYSSLNPIGFNSIYIMNYPAQGLSTAWSLLSTIESLILKDNVGINEIWVDENYGFLAR